MLHYLIREAGKSTGAEGLSENKRTRAAWVTDQVVDRIFFLVLILVGASAFVNLRAFPPFVDESIDLWWLWRIEVAGEWLRPLGDGKPLEAWLAAPLVRLGDPLTVMRAMHVTAGLIAALLVYSLAKQITTRRAALVGALLTAISPFTVLFQRLSLADGYLMPAGVFVLFCIVRFWRAQTWSSALALGMGLVLAAFAKFPIGFMFLGALPLAAISMSRLDRAKTFDAPARVKLLVAHVPVVFLLLVVVAVVALQVRRGELPGFGLHMILEKTRSVDRVATISTNALKLVDDLAVPLTWPVVAVGVVGIALGLLRGSWRQRWLVFIGAAPIVAMVLASTHWSSRYYLFAVPALTVSAVCGWQTLWQPGGRLRVAVVCAALALSVALMGHQSALLIFDPTLARWSKADGYQYIANWPSGYGYAELASYLRSSRGEPPDIYTFEVGTAMQLRAELPPQWGARVQQIQIVEGKALSVEDRQAYLLAKAPTLLVTPAALDDGESYVAKHLRRIAGFDKPRSDVKVTLYEVMVP